MSEAKYTRGPWCIHHSDNKAKVTGPLHVISSRADDCYLAYAAAWNDDVPEGAAEAKANANLIAAAPELLESHEPDREGPDFLDWIADRLVHQYGENPNADFVLCLRRRAEKARAAIAKALGAENAN